MSEAYDVTIDGRGYMLRPGSYERRQSGVDEARTARVRLFDFYGGARRAAQLERDRFWSGTVFPTLDSQGVTSPPKRRDVATTLSTTARRWSFAFEGSTYVVQGNGLYRVTAGASFTGLTLVRTMTAAVVDVTQLGSTLYFAYGSAAVLDGYDLATATYLPTVATVSPKGTMLAGARKFLFYRRAAGPPHNLAYVLVPNGAQDLGTDLDGAIRAMTSYRGSIWVFTTLSIYELKFDIDGNFSGADAVASLPRIGYADDLAWTVTHAGELYLWFGKQVQRYDRTDDTFVPVGLRGRATYGACSVGPYLLVMVDNEHTGAGELWAYDGRGWWQADAGSFRYPVPIFDINDDADVLAGNNPGNFSVWQIFPRASGAGAATSYTLVTPLFDAGERDVDKVWTQAGAAFAWPDGRGTSSAPTVTLEYSTDGGASWSLVASQAALSARVFQVAGPIDPAARSRWLQLRVTVSGITTAAPVLAGLWAEHQTLDPSTRRRRWRFAVHVRDQVVKRDGSVDTTGARALAAQLWDAWEAGTPVTFRDVDYDLAPREYTVRIAAIREEIPKPADAGRWGDGVVELVLVEG